MNVMEHAANLPGRPGHARAAGGLVNRDVALFANAAVDAEVEIGLHSPRTPDDEAVSIFFGQERITLEFYDVESLERLRDLAHEGARRLRTVIEANARLDAAHDNAAPADWPVELGGAGGRSA
ncbi:MAG: hypothetical protein ACRDQ4_12285 [Pseudonocardiaceae bacterium]